MSDADRRRAPSAACWVSSAPGSRSSPPSHDDVPVGFACQSFAALSLDPPLVLFCPTKVSRSWKAIEASGKFCVNVLTEKPAARLGPLRLEGTGQVRRHRLAPFGTRFADHRRVAGLHRLHGGVGARRRRSLRGVRRGRSRCRKYPKIKPRPLLFYRGDYTGIEPDKTTPAQWRDDLEAFLTTTTQDTWL